MTTEGDPCTQRIDTLERELDAMTVALSQAWDQLVPFLQEVPSQAETTHDVQPILEAVATAVDTELAGAFLFESKDWISIPERLVLPSDVLETLCQQTCETTLTFSVPQPMHWAFSPIISEQRRIGLLGVGTPDLQRSFTAVELRIVSRMAERVGAQFAAAQLAHSRAREAATAHELQIASQIQQSIQPLYPPQTPYVQMDTYWNPAKQVGGDAWGWVQQANGRLSWFILDVAGKGLPAALAAASLHTALSMALRLHLSPAEALRVVNEELYGAYTRTDLMATVAILSLHPKTGAFEVANAGHPPILVRHQWQWLRLAATAPPIGVLPTLHAQPQQLTLHSDDLVIGYSDGFTEIQTETGLWGQTGLLKAVPAQATNVQAITQYILRAARHSGRIDDDQTLITALYRKE